MPAPFACKWGIPFLDAIERRPLYVVSFNPSIASLLSTRQLSMLYVLANNIRSLYNVGALFRLADGAGVAKIYLTGITGAPYDDIKHQRQRRQIAKTALEGLDSVPWEYHESPLVLIGSLKRRGIHVVALEQTERSIPYAQADYRSPLCLVLGHETDGVDRSVLEQADSVIELPMYGKGKSLNVISSASVALYHIKSVLP
jgi:tRNA G18 (ribose-2'-O)-methylase SpoU